MTRCLPIGIVFAMGVLSCNRSGGSAEVTRLAEIECITLENDLHAAAAQHRRLAPAIDEHRLDSGQLERANSELAISSVGNTSDVRHARVQEFQDRARFCESIRVLDQKADGDFAVRLDKLRQALNDDIWTGKSASAAKTADLLDDFAGLVHEVNVKPLKP